MNMQVVSVLTAWDLEHGRRHTGHLTVPCNGTTPLAVDST